MRRVIVLLLFIFYNCTSANIWVQFNSTNITNPTPEYNNYYHLFIKGGHVFHLNNIPGGIGNNTSSLLHSKVCSHSILYLVSYGDSSIETAKIRGNIVKVSTVSYEQLGILGFVYHRFCTTVSGE